jgi:hypothetical protein
MEVNALNNHPVVCRHTGEGRYPEGFEIPGFRVALPRTGSGVARNDDAFLLRIWFQNTGISGSK